MKRSIVFLLLFAMSCSSVPTTRVARVPRGSIGGTVLLDGVPLSGATVTISTLGRANVTTVTDGEGRFLAGGFAPGTYVVTTTLESLNPMRQAVELTARRGVNLTMTMHLANVSEAITITASAPSLWILDGASPVGHVSAEYGRFTQGVAASGTTSSTPAPPAPAPAATPLFIQNAVTEANFDVETAQPSALVEHEFIETAKERVTTFAIDVDTASYSNVRRFLTAGQMPPANLVRVEEMINYFRYNDPRPKGRVPFSVTSEVAGCPWNAQNRLVRIGIQGEDLEQWKMAPNNLVFLLDVSGSMAPPLSLPLIQAAFRVLVDQLRAEDRVAIVVYAGQAGLVLPSTSGADKMAILAAIGRLSAGGYTDGGAGIELAYKVARDNFITGGNNRVILGTDGDFNVGLKSVEELQRFIEEKRRTGIFLSVVGVGPGTYQDEMMETLADKGNGNYAYLDSLKEAEKVFKRDLTGTLVTIAKDVKVQVEFDPAHVASYRQIGYENRALANQDFTDDKKDAGELGAGHHVTALYEIVPASTAQGPIGAIRLRYKPPTGDTSLPLDATIVDNGKSAWEASDDMQLASAVAEFAMLLRDSPYKGTSNWDDLSQLAHLAIGADLDGTREEFSRMVESGRAMSNPQMSRKE
jgi:Ca-activated chloride channel homolog